MRKALRSPSRPPTFVCVCCLARTFTCTGFVQLPFAEPELRAVHRAGVELQPEHRVPVGGVHPPVVALDLQGAAEAGRRRGAGIIFSARSVMTGSGQLMPVFLLPKRQPPTRFQITGCTKQMMLFPCRQITVPCLRSVGRVFTDRIIRVSDPAMPVFTKGKVPFDNIFCCF